MHFEVKTQIMLLFSVAIICLLRNELFIKLPNNFIACPLKFLWIFSNPLLIFLIRQCNAYQFNASLRAAQKYIKVFLQNKNLKTILNILNKSWQGNLLKVKDNERKEKIDFWI
ncbi:unnamed protein product [Blepharisma stoltei]|uniref:ATP synthase F0 subunit 8 n=1 Tax=Blepharisma stoltei TaxID=1481888 RepID=A0AAU9IJD2_9CILI|nr:unnamed protein product [Blepharisma stoltei]